MKTKDLEKQFWAREKDVFCKRLVNGNVLEIIEQVNGKLYGILYESNGIDVIETLTIAKAAKLID